GPGSRSWSGRRGRGSFVHLRGLVAADLLSEGLGTGVEDPPRPADVGDGDRERRDELAEAEDETDVDVADELDAHEPGREHRQQDVQEVPREEERGHREDEAAERAAQVAELLGLLDGAVPLAERLSIVAHGSPPGRGWVRTAWAVPGPLTTLAQPGPPCGSRWDRGGRREECVDVRAGELR